MSRPVWLPSHVVPESRVLPFPAVTELQSVCELGGALTRLSPDNLMLEIMSLLNWVIHHKESLTEDMLSTLLADVMAVRLTRCDPMTHRIEVHKAFLSDISAKQARKRRRRQKRVKEDIQQIA